MYETTDPVQCPQSQGDLPMTSPFNYLPLPSWSCLGAHGEGWGGSPATVGNRLDHREPGLPYRTPPDFFFFFHAANSDVQRARDPIYPRTEFNGLPGDAQNRAEKVYIPHHSSHQRRQRKCGAKPFVSMWSFQLVSLNKLQRREYGVGGDESEPSLFYMVPFAGTNGFHGVS